MADNQPTSDRSDNQAYRNFIARKSQSTTLHGFKPLWIPSIAFDFQAHLSGWAIRKGRAAILADCGLGKSLISLVYAENIVRYTNGRVLILTPLAVAAQFVREGEKFGIQVTRSIDGKVGGPGIYVANYDRLHLFNRNDFVGIVCDEASILKNFNGKTRKALTRFMSKLSYRLLATATAAPNDWIELGTLSEALGELSYSDMLRRFFQQLDDKGQKRELRKQEQAEKLIQHDPSYFKKLAFRVSQTIGQWRLRHHAVTHFWRWISSWGRACRMPSDLGFPDRDFVLPRLEVQDHIIKPNTPPPGFLFTLPAVGMYEERQERKRTLEQRCEYTAELVSHNRSAVVWCHTNDEGDRLAELIPDGEQISGKTPGQRREDLYAAFADGSLKKLIIKRKIGAWGLNWQHCNHVVTDCTHSWEGYYQSIRRCWRFGQKNTVHVDVVATEGEERVLANMRAKGDRADKMFSAIVAEMNNAVRIERENLYTRAMEVPQWL